MNVQAPARDRRVVHLLAAGVIALNTIGNAALREGLSSESGVAAFSPMAYLGAFANIWVILGVVLLIAALILELALLSWADLTYVLPVTSLSYAFTPLIGALGLHERVSAVHWCAIALVLAGVIIAGRTKPLTTEGALDR